MIDDLCEQCVLVYLDDILVYLHDDAEHKRHLRTVFQLLQSCKLYDKHTKCEFRVRDTEYLGHLAVTGQVRADPSKISAITDWPQPTSVKHV